MDNPACTTENRDMAKDCDIIIVGGGLNGPSLALALAQNGFSVTLIDALPRADRVDPGFDGRAYAMALASCRLLQGIGVWDAVAPVSQPILDIKVSDGRPGEGAAPWFVHFDHAEIEEGPMGHMVEDRHLRKALLDAIDAQPQIRQLSGRRVVAQDISAAAATVMLDNGAQVSGSLLVGADGRASTTATRAGITRSGWGYGQTALVCAVEHERPHNGCAHQVFLPAGPFAILPLPGNRSSIVWSEGDDLAHQIAAMNDTDYMAALRPRFGDFLGRLSLAGDRFTYPLTLTLADRTVMPRLALVGDAAHGVHPIAGQGLNLGFRDIGALAEVLVLAKRRGQDPGDLTILEDYARWRRFDTTALALATDGVNKLFSNDNSALRLIRDAGLAVSNAIPSLRRAMIREAAGLSGELPRLMQGRPI